MTMRGLSRNRLLAAIVVLTAVVALYLQTVNPAVLQIRNSDSATTTTATTSSQQQQSLLIALAPGELPGYTGWARPERTLAGYFTLRESPRVGNGAVVPAGKDWMVHLQCQGHADCATATSWFYVRAYGPAVITGQVTPVVSDKGSKGGRMYQVRFRPLDPGVYHVEVVLAFSQPPALQAFPLSADHPPVYYEGYLLPGFPMPLTVTDDSSATTKPTSTTIARQDLPFCQAHQLYEASTTTAMERARWLVTDKNHQRSHHLQTSKPDSASLVDYQKAFNSLGVTFEYAFKDCQLLPPSSQSDADPFKCLADKRAKPQQMVHVILIGDSTMRLQKVAFEKQIVQQSTMNAQGKIQVSFIELYGGTLKCIRQTGPNVTTVLHSLAAQPNERRIVLFNTGMHDIHRLCGAEWTEDRQQYLSPHEQEQPCSTLYRQAVRSLADAVQQFSAELKLFQTTTAGWPKHGNYNVHWDPAYGQGLPMDPSFVERFNRLALETLKEDHFAKSNFKIVDGYWITLARPDNRETDRKVSTGKKLSHPGLEVVDAMVRVWTMLVIWTVCQ